MNRKIGFGLALFVLCGVFATWQPVVEVSAKEPVVVVIDPGHGGAAEPGAKAFGGYVEKDLTLQTALALKQTLEKFEGVTVYLTRSQDEVLSAEQRVAIADDFRADFLFSLHYNAIETHHLYGSEVWTSAFGEYYAAGQTFGRLQLAEMAGKGQLIRGTKVHMSEQGSDYYSLIRGARNERIPCVIIEHCFIDNAIDRQLIDSPQKVSALGISDALAVAKYFHLKSPSLGLDYSDYTYVEVEAPEEGIFFPDCTPPEKVQLQIVNADRQTGQVDIRLSAEDAESGILYYSYSLDGGRSWSALVPWSVPGKEMDFSVCVPADNWPLICCRAYNGYDGWTQSNAQAPWILSVEERPSP